HLFLDGLNQLGCRKQRIAALRHRRGPRVVCYASDLDRVLVDADDPVDNADRNTGFIQYATLLDVQFQVAVDRTGHATRALESSGITADRAQAVDQANSIELPLEHLRG